MNNNTVLLLAAAALAYVYWRNQQPQWSVPEQRDPSRPDYTPGEWSYPYPPGSVVLP